MGTLTFDESLRVIPWPDLRSAHLQHVNDLHTEDRGSVTSPHFCVITDFVGVRALFKDLRRGRSDCVTTDVLMSNGRLA